jgi:hypothetical protein
MQELWRESKCENDANGTSFRTINPADAQFDLFDALGINSQMGVSLAAGGSLLNEMGDRRKMQADNCQIVHSCAKTRQVIDLAFSSLDSMESNHPRAVQRRPTNCIRAFGSCP